MTRRRAAVLAVVAALALGIFSASADDYPARPVRIIVPFPPGGSTDIVARTLASALAPAAGQPFVIENRAGAGGVIGADAAQHAAPDGYTLLFAPTTLIIATETERAAGRTPPVTMDRFAPVAQVVSDPLIVVARGNAPWRTIRDLLADPQARTGRFTYGSGGEGSSSHIAMRALTTAAGTSLVHVPYRGTAPALADLIAGRIDVVATNAAIVKAHVDAGRLHALVTLARARSPLLPNTPSAIEAGLGSFAVPTWMGLFAPSGTPEAVQVRLHELVRRAMSDRGVSEQLARLGMDVDVRVGDAFRRGVSDDTRTLAALVRGTPAVNIAALPTTPTAPSAAPPSAPPSSSAATAGVGPSARVAPPADIALSPAPPAATAPAPAAASTFGRYHALVIGNQTYQHLPRLKTPAADARAVADLLRTDYSFQNVTLLVDATRADMVRALDAVRRQLVEDDNLLIYYAGHGWLDREADRGYWLGVDAETDTRANWLSNADITDTLRALRAKHVLIVADSCYSGTLVRDVGIRSLDSTDLVRLARRRARTVLTSGGAEPVMDEGGGGHSVFARAFIETLRGAPAASDVSSLFGGLRRSVLLRAEQTPQYGDLRLSGHDGGDFIFVRRR